MNDNNLKNLISELKAEGASEKEADDLALFSKNISNLLQFERSEEIKLKFLKNAKPPKNNFSKKYGFAVLFSVLLLLGFSSVVSAQKSLPGDTLYPVKIASENIASFINPSFKNEIIKRRSDEIKSLSKENNSTEFHEAIRSYEKELDDSKQINSTNIEESRKNLEEAQKNSLEDNKEDLEKIIIKTRDIQESLEKSEVKGEHTDSLEDKSKREVKDELEKLEEDKIPNILEH